MTKLYTKLKDMIYFQADLLWIDLNFNENSEIWSSFYLYIISLKCYGKNMFKMEEFGKIIISSAFSIQLLL